MKSKGGRGLRKGRTPTEADGDRKWLLERNSGCNKMYSSRLDQTTSLTRVNINRTKENSGDPATKDQFGYSEHSDNFSEFLMICGFGKVSSMTSGLRSGQE
jgi:hypothetical protein